VHQRLNRRRPERRDPLEPRDSRQLFPNAGRRQHPPVPDENQPFQAKALAHRRERRRDRLRIPGIAVEHFHRHRTARGIRQHAEHDLQFVALAVPRMPQLGERAPPPLKVRRGYVVEHQLPGLQVPPGQRLFDGALPRQQPVQGRVEIVFIHRRQPQPGAEGAGASLLR
jgi:hypothetical protein